jgi:protein tyrosine phosphatase (PTP) superfamily phosphohydrolase (DUF442 family)
MTTTKRSRRHAVWAVRLGAVLIISPLLFVAWNQATYNFGEVQPDRIYRSGQMPASALVRTIREHHIKTVLNLRGSNQVDTWYREEVAATNGLGATQIDVAMSSCVWMSRAQLQALIEAVDTAEYPMLIHCAWGSERTGLVSAFVELLRPGGTFDDALAQLSARHLFVRINDGKVMAEHLDQYETWLRSRNLQHEPANFRQWVKDGFKPGIPSREQWPYDPYPLIVITRPGAPPEATPLAGAPAGQKQRR